MADLIEYLIWRGDLTFAERPFNDVDNVVLSQLCYVDLDDIAPETGQGSLSLSEAAKRYAAFESRAVITGQMPEKNDEFFYCAAKSPRFRDTLLSDYVNIIDENQKSQFSAVCFTLSDGSRYLSFRGTDDTVVGWREDFMISYEVTEAQTRAAVYLREMVEGSEEDVIWRIGGHSKGGNLALYAALNVPAKIQDRLCAIYSNDGPGIAPEMFERVRYERIWHKVTKIVPAYSIVGMLFERPFVRENPEGSHRLHIVQSSGKGMMQHWALTWQVKGADFVRAEDFEPGARHLDEVLDRWISSATFEEREAFVGALFDAMASMGGTLSEVMDSGAWGLNLVAEFAKKSNADSRHAVVKFFRALFRVGEETAGEKADKTSPEA